MNNLQMQLALKDVGRRIQHPGKILKRYLKEMKISQYKLAKDINVSQTRISEIINGKRNITIDTALRLAKYFSTSHQFWLNIQHNFELKYYEFCRKDISYGVKLTLNNLKKPRGKVT